MIRKEKNAAFTASGATVVKLGLFVHNEDVNFERRGILFLSFQMWTEENRKKLCLIFYD